MENPIKIEHVEKTMDKLDAPRMTIEEISDMLTLLSTEFKVDAPKFRVSDRIHHAVYSPTKALITLPVRHGYGTTTENSTLHEFAHHLNYRRHILEFREMRLNGKNFPHHGIRFQETLEEVIMAWYKDIHKYQWNKEYDSVADRYRKNYSQGTIPHID